MGPRDRLVLRVEPRRELIVRRGTIKPVLHVVLARPDHLHRRIHRLRDAHGLGNKIRLEPPPETATEQRGVNPDLLDRHTGRLGGDLLRARLILRRRPHFAAVRAREGRAVHRLHRGVMEERYFVHGFDTLRGSDERGEGVTILARLGSGLAGERRQPGRYVAERGVRSLVPWDLEGLASLDGLPVGVGDDGDAALRANAPRALHAGPRRAVEWHRSEEHTSEL